jgi:hypothetical protein
LAESFDGIQAPLELFSLEEEAALLPGGLFVFPLRVVKIELSVWNQRQLGANNSVFSTYQLLCVFCVAGIL